MAGYHPPCFPSLSWGCTKRRSGPEHRRPAKQGRVRGHGSGVINAGVLNVNHVEAALPRAPQDEAGPDLGSMNFVVDETGLEAGEAVTHRSDLQQKIRVEANARQVPAPRTDSTREFSSEQRPLNLRTIPAAEDANQHDVRKSQFKLYRLTTSEEKLYYPAPPPRAPPTLHTGNSRATKRCHGIELPKLVQDYSLRTQKAAGARSLFRRSTRRGGKPNSSTLRLSFLSARKKLISPGIAISSQVPEKYSCRPPHPLDVGGGKVSHVNICPVCENYTVTELDRSAAAGTGDGGETTLRARFHCGLCREVFDLGIALFDPRGIPGVAMYRNEDRFRPPVPPRGKYPCPRCWKNAHTEFQCMVAYLREESKVPCEPACPAERLDVMSSCNWGKPEEKQKMEARSIIRTVLGLF